MPAPVDSGSAVLGVVASLAGALIIQDCLRYCMRLQFDADLPMPSRSGKNNRAGTLTPWYSCASTHAGLLVSLSDMKILRMLITF
jgi:hypothetical protein